VGSIGALWVAIRGEDKDLKKTLREDLGLMRRVDRTKVSPQVELPNVRAEIQALEARLKRLGKTRTKLNIDVGAAGADIDTIQRQLSELEAKRTTVDIALQEDVDREIDDLRSQLAAVERRKTRIPLELERVDAQVATIEAKIKSIRSDGVEVPVELTGMAKLRAQLASLGKGQPDLQIRVRPINPGGTGDFNPVKMLRIPALLGAAHVAASALASVTAGAVALTSAIAPAGLAMAALPVGMGAAGQAYGVVAGAFAGFNKALQATVQIQQDAAGVLDLTPTKIQNLKNDLEAAGPAMRNFTATIADAVPELMRIREVVRNILLGQLGDSIRRIGAVYFPILQDQSIETANRLALVADALTDVVTEGDNVGRLSRIFDANQRMISVMGFAAVDAGAMLIMLWEGALPLAERFVGWLGRSASKLRELVTAASESGALTDAFNSAGDVAAQLGRIFGNLTVGLYNVFAGGYEQGKSFLDLFDTLTKRFADWTGTLEGKNAITDFFNRARPTLDVIGHLITDIAGGFGKMAQNTDITPVLEQFRSELLPALGDLVSAVDDDLLPSMVGLATSVVDFYSILSGESGALTITVDILKGFADSILWLIHNVPGATQALGLFFAAAAVRQAFGIITLLTGLRGLILASIGLNVATGPLATSIIALATAEGRANIATTLRAAATRAAAIWTALSTAYTTAATVATLVFSAAVRLLNAAWKANPIGMVIAILGLLALGIIYAYKHSETFRNIVNAVGAALKVAFLAAVAAVGRAVQWLGGVWGTIATAITGAWGSIKSAVATGWAAVVGFFSSVGTAIATPIVAAFNSVVGFLAPIFSAIGAFFVAAFGIINTIVRTSLAVIITIFVVTFLVVRKVLEVAWGLISALFTIAGNAIVETWTGVWAAIKDTCSLIWGFVYTSIIAPVWAAITGAWTTATTYLQTTWNAWWGAIKADALAGWNAVYTQVIQPVWNAITGAWNAAVSSIRSAWTTFWTALKADALAGWNAVKNGVIVPVWNAIKGFWNGIVNSIRTSTNTWWAAIKADALAGWNAVKNGVIVPVWNAIKGAWDAAREYIRNKMTNWWNAIKNDAKAGFDAVKEAISRRWDLIKSNWDTIMGRIKEGTKSFVSSIGRIFNGIKDAFSGPWNWVKEHVFNKIATVYNRVAKLVGGKTIDLSDGGSVAKNVTVRVGGGPTASANADGGLIQARAGGGPVLRRDAGGMIRGIGGPREDNIMGVDPRTKIQTSWVSPKEYVVNAKSTAANYDLVEAINKAHGPLPPIREAGRAASYAYRNGGLIPRLFAGGRAPVPGRFNSHGPNYYGANLAGDFPVGTGTPVHAWKAGVVAAVRYMTTSYGRHVRVNHQGNQTLYAHLRDIAVNAGQRVSAGQVLGHTDSTGNSTGPHLHFEIRGGSAALNAGRAGGGGGVADLLSFIKPRAMFTKAANAIVNNVSKGLGALGLGLGNTPAAQMIGRLPHAIVDLLASKLPESFGVPDTGGGDTYTGPVGAGAAGIRRLAQSFTPSYIAGHRDPQGLPAMDIGSFGAKNTSIGNALRANHAKLGLRYVIRQMQIASPRQNWAWRRYSPITGAGDFRHVQHVHVSYADGGRVQGGLANGGVVAGGRGGVTARVGEGRFDELVTPLPRDWKRNRGDDMARLIALIEERGLDGPHIQVTAVNPIAETASQTTNKTLQRVANLGLV
jgi:murein DD-endopeptidase MepM/ murein hydrolase activator NlpD